MNIELKHVTVRDEKRKSGDTVHVILFNGRMVGKVVGTLFYMKRNRQLHFHRNMCGYAIHDEVLKAAEESGAKEVYLMEQEGPTYTYTIDGYWRGIELEDPKYGPQHLVRFVEMRNLDRNQMELF